MRKRSKLKVIAAWSSEALLLVAAIASLAGIIAILWIYNGEESPAWQYSINLNSLVAVLSTTLRAALMITVAEGKALT